MGFPVWWNLTEASLCFKPHSCLAPSHYLSPLLLGLPTTFSPTKPVGDEPRSQAMLWKAVGKAPCLPLPAAAKGLVPPPSSRMQSNHHISLRHRCQVQGQAWG